MEVDELPRKLAANPPPPYPADALARRSEGRVVLLVRVTSEGTVSEASISRTSGDASLDASALSAVRAWRFSPARRAGVAVGFDILVPVNFSIRS